MNAEDLIRSGLLEGYALGHASEEEAAFVERMASIEPSVKEELDRIQAALEAQALATAVDPPAHVRAKVLARIAETPVNGTIPIRRRTSGAVVLAAASVVGLLISGALNYVQFKELREVRSELARAESERSILAQEVVDHRTNLVRAQDELAVVLDPGTRTVELSGMGPAEGARARVFWDPVDHKVLLDPMTLAPPPEGMQYQLWALVDGEPVDAGLIAVQEDPTGLHVMRNVPVAQAFAVTIEKRGGSPTPTLEAMVLLGQV